jgi:hypothetical protein
MQEVPRLTAISPTHMQPTCKTHAIRPPPPPQPANHRSMLMVLWLAKYGVGIVPLKDVILAAKRVRVS